MTSNRIGEKPALQMITEAQHGGLSQPEKLSQEFLWENPKVFSFTIRRHGEVSMSPVAGRNKGILLGEAYRDTKKIAEEFVQQTKLANASMTLNESPSCFSKGKRKKPISHDVRMRRASVTASVWEKAVFGKLAPPVTTAETGEKMSSVRRRDNRLGDLFESCANAEQAQKIGDFFKLRSALYCEEQGISNTDFWSDFVKGELPKNLFTALDVAGGSDSRMLASNLTKFLKQESLSEEHTTKQIGIAITHSETIESFLFHLGQFLKEGEDSVALSSYFEDPKVQYNEGFDIHTSQKGDSKLFLPSGDHVAFNLDALDVYINRE